MSLRPNASLKFTGYKIERDGIEFLFVCPDPGAAQASEYSFYATNAEVAVLTDLNSFTTLALARLKRKYRAEGIAAKLDSLIGRTLTLP